MNTWSRNGDADFDSFSFHVKLAPSMWYTAGRTDKAGSDFGGLIDLTNKVAASVKDNDAFEGYVISRRATRTFFLPEIVVKDEPLPEHLNAHERIGQFALGPQYDVFISFGSKNEATLFKMSNRGDVNVGFDGIN